MAEFAKRGDIEIEFGEVKLENSNNVSVRDVSIGFPPSGTVGKTFARVPRIDVQANPILVLLGRNFPVTVTLFNPHVNLERRADGTWEIPFLSRTWSGDHDDLPWDHTGPVTVEVRSGSIAVRHEGWNAPVRVEKVNLSVRSSAVKRALRVEGALSLPAVSANPLMLDGWVYPSDGRFDIRQKASGLSALAINDLITTSPLDVRGGTLDCTLRIRGAVGRSTVVRGPVVFSTLQIDNLPKFSREIDGTAELSFTVNQETSEVLVEKLRFDTGPLRGSLSGTFAFGDVTPALHLRATLDSFSIDELVRLAVQERFPTVSDISVSVNQDVRVALTAHGDIQKPEVEAVAPSAASSVALTVQTQSYGPLNLRAQLRQTLFRWSTEDGASGDTTIGDGTLSGGRLPFALHNVSGTISLRDDIVKTGHLAMLVDDVPASLSGYADISDGTVPAAGATVQCTMDNFSHSKHVSALKGLKLSGGGLLTSRLEKSADRARWDVDAELTDTEVSWQELFHKPAGATARAHLEGFITSQPFSSVHFRASLGESCVAGHATMARADSPSCTALDLRSESLDLAETMSFLNLPVEVHEDAGAQLAIVLDTTTGRPQLTATASADHLALATKEQTRQQPMQLTIENMQASLDGDANGYRSALRCRSVQLAPALNAFVKRPYRPAFPERFGSPLHIDISIDKLASEPCDIDQLHCAALLSKSELTLSSATGSVAGGTFQVRGAVAHDDGTFSFEYDCDGCDLGEMLSWASKETLYCSGDLSARGLISGVRGDAASRLGQCSLTATNGQIDSSQLIARTRGLEQVSKPMPIEFETLQCDFSLDNDTINVSNLQMERPGLMVRGGGSITLDGEVDHTFDVEMSRAVAEQLSARKGWSLMEALTLPVRRSEPIVRSFRLTGQLGSLEAEVERRPLHVELIRGTLAFSENLVVAGVTLITAPARIFIDILTSGSNDEDKLDTN